MAEERDDGQNHETRLSAALAEAGGVEEAADGGAEASAVEEQQQASQAAEPAGKPDGEAADPPPPLDKVRQQVQQELGNLVRSKIEPLQQRLDQIAAALEAGRITPQQAERQAQAVEEKIDDLGIKDDDVFLSTDAGRKLAAEVSKLRKENAEIRQQSDRVAQQIDADRFWRDFDRSTPELAGKGPELAQEAADIVAKRYPHLKDPAQVEAAINVTFDNLVEQRKGAAQPAKPHTTPAKQPSAESPARRPNVVRRGASAGRPVQDEEQPQQRSQRLLDEALAELSGGQPEPE